jgi:hypothetical protein
MPDMVVASDDTPFNRNVAFASGVSLAVDASTIVESSAAASCFRRQLFDLAAAGLELSVAIDSSSPDAMHDAEYEFVLKLCGRAMQDAGAPTRRLAVVTDAAAVKPQVAWALRRRHLGIGPLFVRLAQQPMRESTWQQLWELRTEPCVGVLCTPFVTSPCRLLPVEQATCLIPGASVQGPAGSAWVEVVIDVADIAAEDGRIDGTRLDTTIGDAVVEGEQLHSTSRWPTARLRHDAWLNRRLAIEIRGIGSLVHCRGLDPESFGALSEMKRLLRRVRDCAVARSHQIAATAGHVPALEQANLANFLPGGRLRNDWAKRWRLAVEATAVRHRNLLAMSPWSLFPPGRADLRYVNLLPLLRYADTCCAAATPEVDHWKFNEFRGFHQQAAAVLQQRTAAHQIAVPV